MRVVPPHPLPYFGDLKWPLRFVTTFWWPLEMACHRRGIVFLLWKFNKWTWSYQSNKGVSKPLENWSMWVLSLANSVVFYQDKMKQWRWACYIDSRYTDLSMKLIVSEGTATDNFIALDMASSVVNQLCMFQDTTFWQLRPIIKAITFDSKKNKSVKVFQNQSKHSI